jgi:protein arginine kinase activator
MICENCRQRIASVHFTQIINNKKVEMHLCKQCAKEKGQFNFGPSIDMSDFFKGLMSVGYSPGYITDEPRVSACKKCGMTYEDFQKTGKLGCDNCYAMYRDSLIPLLKRLHGSVEHHGKYPGKVLKNLQDTVKLEKLKELLAKAIEKEEYEKAAELRDKIKSMESSKQ